MKRILSLACALIATLCAVESHAQLLLNEIVVNTPGADEPYEFIELKGTPNSTLNNIYVVVFESDSGSAGNADVVIPLNGVTLGSNGLLFIGTSLGYQNIPAETAFIDTLLFGLPILENGSITFAVLFSPINIVKDADYDTNNDGVLDLPNGAVLQDAVGWTNGDVTALVYGGVILTQSAGTPDAAVRFFDNTTPFSKPAWYNGDLTTLSTFDPLEISSNFPQGAGITPGNVNVPNNGIGFNTIQAESLKIYPNPCENLLQIQDLNLAQENIFSLYSIDGRLLRREILNSTQINLQEIESGMYWVEVRNNTELKRAQVVKVQ